MLRGEAPGAASSAHTMRVLLFATTTGYQVRAFDEAAALEGVDLQLATDRCDRLDDPWRDRAIPVRFHEPAGAVERIAQRHADTPFHGVLAVGDRAVGLAAVVAEHLGLRWHQPSAAAASRNKLRTRERLRDAGLLAPAFGVIASEDDLAGWTDRGPIVVKPIVLSGSRGVIRADTPAALRSAWARVGRLLDRPDVRALRDPDARVILVEQFIPGQEFALEGLLSDGRLRVLAIFDKPDPLYGPFFEETLYITPSRASRAVQRALERTVADACRALGLTDGPIHAECRVNRQGVFVLEVAPRPIGGLCARMLRFAGPGGRTTSLEGLLLRHALGKRVESWRRDPAAAGVMMIPIPAGGVFRGIDGLTEARAVAGIDEVVVTAKVDQLLEPLPEGATYLGFIFARGTTPTDVESALRVAHGHLQVKMERAIPLVE